MVRMFEAAADRVLALFVPRLTAQAAGCTCWTEYCGCSGGRVQVRDCCRGCDSGGTTCGYCRTTTTRC
ncbi:hypothetical protein [Plantactinospora sp. GCM10030261]|uniref:hypothetical protein n=1 Tax=Plantactinospora sp. GCM10030261 TaxID=3273420 RepID=UPI003609FB9F